jgi:hypothetical protein
MTKAVLFLGAPGQTVNAVEPAISFVLECLLLLPVRLCVAVANQVIPLHFALLIICIHDYPSAENVL